MQELLKCIRKADDDFNLIHENDHIVIGVSGGKDSVVLLYALYLYSKFKEKHFTFTGVYMNMGFKDTDISPVVDFAKKFNIPFKCIDVPIYEILTHYKKENGALDCSRCSNLKRGAIVNIAKELNANKIAFAHHGDDAIETLFMNAIYSGKFDTFQPKINYNDNDVIFIRPFIYAKESSIMHALHKYAIPSVNSGCPNDGNTSRSVIKETLKSLYKVTPNAKNNILKALSSENGVWKKDH